MDTQLETHAEGKPILSLHRFRRQAGISETTAWRRRPKGWLATINIAGRQYITRRAMAEFLRRAEAGEFAQVPILPGGRPGLLLSVPHAG